MTSDDSEAESEIQHWIKFEQDILHMSRKAESYIDSNQVVKEPQSGTKAEVSVAHKFCSGVSHLRLPKFTLPVFNGDILEWIPLLGSV